MPGSPNPPVRSDDDDIDALLGETIAKVGESQSAIEASAKLQVMLDAARGKPRELVDPRSLPVRFSRLKQLALSGAHYLDSCQDEIDESLALRLGAGVHAGLFLNRPVVCYDGRRAGKAWERFEKHWLEKSAVILNEREYVLATGVIDAVRRHKRAMEILFDGTTTEERIDWSYCDRSSRSTPDSYHRAGTHNTDLKSTRCAEPRTFARDAFRRQYHAQLSFYGDALETKLGKRPGEDFIVAVENVRPFNVVVFRFTDEARTIGAKLVRTWFEQLLNCERSNHYPGYAESDLDLEPPHFEDGAPFELEVEGRLVAID